MNSNMKIEVVETACRVCEATFFEFSEWPLEEGCPHCTAELTNSTTEIVDTKEVELQVDYKTGEVKVIA